MLSILGWTDWWRNRWMDHWMFVNLREFFLDGLPNGWIDGQMDGSMDGWTNRWMDWCLLISFKTTDLPKGHNRLGDWYLFLDYWAFFLDGLPNGWIDGQMDGSMDGWTNRWMDWCLLISFKTTDLPKGHNRLGDWYLFLDYWAFFLDGLPNGWIDGQMDGLMDKWTTRWMDRWMFVFLV